MYAETKTVAGETSIVTSPCSFLMFSSVSGGYVRGQQVWYRTSISSDAKDCDLEQVTSPDVKVHTSMCEEEL